MPISRGSVRHSLGTDVFNLIRSLLWPAHLTQTASDTQKERVVEKISRRYDSSCILFPYARTAFYAALKSLDLPKNSEILLTPITIGPMLEVIVSLGHKPVFVDIELETFCVDLDDLKRKLARGPRCFLLTYLFGYVPNIREIFELCEKSGTVVIEDISHNIGAKFEGRPLGTYGVVGIYSASMLKYVDSYNGAFLITNDRKIYDILKAVVANYSSPDPRRVKKIIQSTLTFNFSLSRVPFNFLVFPLLWFIKKFDRRRFEKILGPKIALEMRPNLPNYYFEDIASIQCEMIDQELDKLDDLIKTRRKCAFAARDAFQDVIGRSLFSNSNHEEFTFWQFVLPVRNLLCARDILFQNGVETGGTNLMNLAEVRAVNLPGAKALKDGHIFIPLHEHLSIDEYRRIFTILKPYLALLKLV